MEQPEKKVSEAVEHSEDINHTEKLLKELFDNFPQESGVQSGSQQLEPQSELQKWKQDKCFETENNLIDLIHVYDAAMKLYHMGQELTGKSLSSESVISELLRVTNVIQRICDDSPERDWEESEIKMVLDQEGVLADERAMRLLWIMELR